MAQNQKVAARVRKPSVFADRAQHWALVHQGIANHQRDNHGAAVSVGVVVHVAMVGAAA
jgi:hypothetical protein